MRIALIGCGAIAEQFHIPGLLEVSGSRSVPLELVLVDRDPARSAALESLYPGARSATDYASVLQDIDAAVVATPPQTHAAIASDLIKAGVPVLCEKPLTVSTHEAETLLRVVEDGGTPLAVNQTRRFMPAAKAIRDVIASREMGAVLGVSVEEGDLFDWPITSPAMFGRASGGRGVFLDIGVHVVDLINWWLGSDGTVQEYRDDSRGGSEASCHARLSYESADVDIRLSWLARMRNTFHIRFEQGEIEWGTYDLDSFKVRSGRESRWAVRRAPERAASMAALAPLVLHDFLRAVETGERPRATASDALASIEVIEACYAGRTSFHLPWESFPPVESPRSGDASDPISGPRDLQGAVLVTGAGGFIGGRVVEALHQAGQEVKAGVRRWSSCARIGRLPIDFQHCDIMDPSSLVAAMQGTDAVIHCAVGSPEVTVEGTRRLLQAALDAGVRRVVHLSTMDVYGDQRGEISEAMSPVKSGKPYGDSKIDAEEVCREFAAAGLEVVILRPTIVYGPFSQYWVIEPGARLLAREWSVPRETCQGTCNLVYVDDVVRAALLALRSGVPSGDAHNVNGPDRPTWQAYIELLNQKLDQPALDIPALTGAKLRTRVMDPVRWTVKTAYGLFQDQVMSVYRRSPLARSVIKRVESRLKAVPSQSEFDLYSRVIDIQSDSAESELGYRPVVDMDRGVAMSAAWLLHETGHPTDAT